MHYSLILALLPYALAAPLITPRGTALIPGKYIVKLKAEASKENLEEAKALLTSAPDHEYEFGDFSGFAGSISPSTVSKLQALDAVCIPYLFHNKKVAQTRSGRVHPAGRSGSFPGLAN